MIKPATRLDHVEEYYFSKKLAEIRKMDSPDFPVINLGIGNPDQMPAQEVIEELSLSASQPHHHGYQSYKGVKEFRNAIADFYLRTYDVALDPEQMILPLMGSKEGILHISLAFLNEGDEVLIPDPGYPTYASVAHLVGAKVKTYDLLEENDWKIDIDKLAARDLSRVKLMWINYPHMPTGRQATRHELEQLIALARKHQFLIVNDNPYSLILTDHPTSLLSIAGALAVALELNSLSKSHNMAGWRLGWVAGKKEYVDAILQVRSNMDSGMFLPMQHAAVKALQLGEGWFDQLNRVYAQRKKIVLAILDELNCTYTKNQAGLFVWARAPAHLNVEKWVDKLLHTARVFVTPGFIFGKNGKQFVRVSLCNPVDVLETALERIQKSAAHKISEQIAIETIRQ